MGGAEAGGGGLQKCCCNSRRLPIEVDRGHRLLNRPLNQPAAARRGDGIYHNIEQLPQFPASAPSFRKLSRGFRIQTEVTTKSPPGLSGGGVSHVVISCETSSVGNTRGRRPAGKRVQSRVYALARTKPQRRVAIEARAGFFFYKGT